MQPMSEWIKIIDANGSLKTINSQTVSSTTLKTNGMMELDTMQGFIEGKYMGSDIIFSDGQDKFLTSLLNMLDPNYEETTDIPITEQSETFPDTLVEEEEDPDADADIWPWG